MAPEVGPRLPSTGWVNSLSSSWPSPQHRPTPPQTQMAQLASLSTIGLGDQSAFNEIVGAEHLGRTRRADQGHRCSLCLGAWGRGGDECLSLRAEGRLLRGQEGKESPQDLGVEMVNEELCCASGLRCDAGLPFSKPQFAHLENDDKCSIQLPGCGRGRPDQWETRAGTVSCSLLIHSFPDSINIYQVPTVCQASCLGLGCSSEHTRMSARRDLRFEWRETDTEQINTLYNSMLK